MMKKKIYILIFILMMVFVPMDCLATVYITGNQTLYDGSGKVLGKPSCTASGTISEAHQESELEDGVCDGGGVKHEGGDYCCDAAHNGPDFDNCQKTTCESTESCHGGYGGKYKTECEKNGGVWYKVCTTDRGTKYTYIHYYEVKPGATGNGTCGTGTVTCRGAKSGSVTGSFETYQGWTATSTDVRRYGIKLHDQPDRKDMEENSGCAAYEGIKFDGVLRYKTRYNRCCGTASEAAHNYKPLEDDPKVMGCWRREKSSSTDISIFGTDDNYEYIWSHVGYSCTNGGNACVCGKDNNGTQRCNSELPGGKAAGWQLYKVEGNDMNETLCHTQKPAICTTPPAKEFNEKKNATSCNQKNVSVPFNEDIACSTNDSTFYKIGCIENASASYYPDNFEKKNGIEGKVVVLQPGQGFGFNIKMDHVRKCEGTFDSGLYNKTYQAILDLLKRAESMFSGREDDDFRREYAWYNSHKEELDRIAKTYEEEYSYILNDEKYLFNYDGQMSFDYLYKGNKFTKTVDFLMNEDEEYISLENGQPTFTKTHDLKNKMRVYDFSYTFMQEALLEPKEVYFDKIDGFKEVVKTETNGAVYGGKKIYTEVKTDLTVTEEKEKDNYHLSSVINIYKATAPTKIIANIYNNNCEIKVFREKDTYRIIDVINPFVNNTREIPWNWRNYTQDFTNTIHKDTWSDSRTPLYSFDLSKEQISSIKSSNANNKEAYLGTCHESESMQDPIMKEICRVINSK